MKKLLLTLSVAAFAFTAHGQDILFSDDGLDTITNQTITASGGTITTNDQIVYIGLRRSNNRITISELPGNNEQFTVVYRALVETDGGTTNALTNAVGKIVSQPFGNEAGANTPDVLQFLKDGTVTNWSNAEAIANYTTLKDAITRAAREKARLKIQQGQ